MADKYRVNNPQKFDVGVVTLDKPLGINIKAGAFAILTQDEIDYLIATSTLFQRGILHTEKGAEEMMQSNGIDVANDVHFITDDEIKKKLGGSVKKIEEWLSTIEEGYIFDRIYDVSKEMNLNISKVRALQAKMPTYNFIEE